MSIQLKLTGAQTTWAALGLDRVRIYVDAEASQVSAVREALQGKHRDRVWMPPPHAIAHQLIKSWASVD